MIHKRLVHGVFLGVVHVACNDVVPLGGLRQQPCAGIPVRDVGRCAAASTLARRSVRRYEVCAHELRAVDDAEVMLAGVVRLAVGDLDIRAAHHAKAIPAVVVQSCTFVHYQVVEDKVVFVVAVHHIIANHTRIQKAIRARVRGRRVDKKLAVAVGPPVRHARRGIAVGVIEERLVGQHGVDWRSRVVRVNAIAHGGKPGVVQHNAAPEPGLGAAAVVSKRDGIAGRAIRGSIQRLMPLAATLKQDLIPGHEAGAIHFCDRLPRRTRGETVVGIVASVADVVGGGRR